MAKVIIPQSNFKGGLSFSEKEGLQSSFLFARSIDYRSDPSKLKILPKTAKVSGTIVTDLILDGDRQGTDTYLYGDTGKVYLRDSSETWSVLRTVPSSQGNGMAYFGEDSFLYYTSNTVIGRYGPFGGTKAFTDDFLGAEGGVPLNTHSLDLELSSSQYATAADSASLSITGDITLESYVKLESLPAVGGIETFISKWNTNGNLRSYTFELYGISGYFGDGGDGALTISTDTTQAPTDSAATGTAAAYTLTATNASFVVDQKILIHQSRGTNAGVWERNEIAGYTAGTITLTNALTNTYTSGAQVIVLPEYTNVTVNSGKTWTAKAWNGTVGGILAFLANGTVTITGTINAAGLNGATGSGNQAGGQGIGFRGATTEVANNNTADQGEGTAGAGTASTAANGNGGGGGSVTTGNSYGTGGGGGNGAAGLNGEIRSDGGVGTAGTGGSTVGTADLTTMVFGGGGGGGAVNIGETQGGAGGGGGIIFIIGTTVTITGTVTANGGNAGANTGGRYGGGGGGGSILLKAQTATLGSALITATGGTTTSVSTGGVGRIHLDYYTSYTGTTSPTLNATQDGTLVTTTSYQLRIGISSTGTNEEFLTKTLPNAPNTSQWYRFAVSWDASASQAEFYVDGVSIGTATGTLTAIYNSTALLAIGARFGAAGAAVNFLDGKTDDNRIWNDIRTTAELYNNKDTEIAGTSANLQAYWQHDNALTDETVNANTLTLVAAPVYSTDVPFASPTARVDLDQSLNTSGQTYTLPTAINEGATHRQSFVPAKDPQKSIEVLIADIGSGNWTLTVHDALNREVVTAVTVTNANLNTGDYEFKFTTPWRPVVGATYHFHLTSTVADGTVTTTTVSDLETADFHTYYQFLISDANHQIIHHAEKLNIANERYLATWNAITYNPHRITLPSGFRIRALGIWREYLVMGVTRGTNLTDYDQGYLFFWDGIHTTYNFYLPIPEGGVNAIMSGDPMYFIAGYSGDLMKYEGGIPKKIRRLPKVDHATTLEINRKAIAMWKALVRIGIAENSTSTAIERGVYSYGTLAPEVAPTLSFDYPLSLGITTGANLEIGALISMGSNLLISWRNGTSYGVDKVDPTASPFSTATIEFLIIDAKKIWAEKQAQIIRAYFKALAGGDTVKLKYKIDRASSWIEGKTDNQQGYAQAANDKECRLPLPTKGNRFNEFQLAIDLTTTNSASPEVYGYGIEIDDLTHERRT